MFGATAAVHRKWPLVITLRIQNAIYEAVCVLVCCGVLRLADNTPHESRRKHAALCLKQEESVKERSIVLDQ